MIDKFGPVATGRDDLGARYAYLLTKPGSLRYFPNPWIATGKAVIPPFSGHVATSASDYFRFVDSKRRRRLLATTQADFDAACEEYVATLVRLESCYGHLLTDYDRDVVLSNTCALGVMPTGHFDMDEKGVFGTGRRFAQPSDLINIVESDLALRCVDPGISLTLKRGTNLGYPTQKAGRSRDEGDVLLALHVALTIGARSRGMRLQDLQRVIESRFGPCFCIGGERYQHTDRVTPHFHGGTVSATHNLEKRVRGIYFSPKFMVAWNRRYVKTVLHGIMDHPMHIQDRATLREWFVTWKNDAATIAFSLDVSRFDQSHGITAVDDILRMIGRLCSRCGLGSPDEIYSDLLCEFTVDDLVSTSRALFLEKGGQILSSGLSMTSIVGCLASHFIAYHLASFLTGLDFSQTHEQFNRTWSAMTWGDDVVFAIKKNALCAARKGLSIDSLKDDLKPFSDSIGLSFDAEPTIKFLGQNYDMLKYSQSATTGYPIGRFVQQQFLPERAKVYPFREIGYIARLSLIDQNLQNQVHDATMKLDPFDGFQFSYASRFDVLHKLLPEVEKFSQNISQLDDVLGIFTHGLDPSDLEEGALGEFEGLLAIGSIDMSDPIAVISHLTRPVSNAIISGIRDLMKGHFTHLPLLLQNIGRMYGSKAPLLGQMYY